MLDDRYGMPVSTASSAARDAYVEGVDLLFSANFGPVEAFDRALAADANFALAHAGRARALQLRGEMGPAREAMAAAKAAGQGVSEREVGHLGFYDLVIAGQGAAAVAAAKAHLASFPRDAMVLSPCTSVFGLIGFSGRAGREREQVELLEGLAAHYSGDWWFDSQHAFALDEVGQRGRARDLIERAMAQSPRNAHGAHIRAHVCYEDGEQAKSRDYLRQWMPAYEKGAQLFCHLSWHQALCALEAGDIAEAWRVYDAGIEPTTVWGPPLNALTDAAAFLWRAELAGVPRDAARWRVVHDYAHRMFPRAGIAFADVHVLLADAVVGDTEGHAARLRELAELERAGRLPSGPLVPALGDAFLAFARGDWQGAIGAIEPVLSQHERIGGSRAQRDLVEFTLLKAYANAKRTSDVHAYMSRRREGPRGIPVAGIPGVSG
jgi:hypothetical protein